jgi:hypothetical protein
MALCLAAAVMAPLPAAAKDAPDPSRLKASRASSTLPYLHTSTLSHGHTASPTRSRPHTPTLSADLPPLCSALYQLQHQSECPDLGPGQYAQTLTQAGLSYPLPPLAVVPERPYRGLTPDAYARIITDTAPVYRTPYDALAGLPPMRRFEKGFEFVSVVGTVTVEGQPFYQINPGEYMLAEHVTPAIPSSFGGRFLAEPPSSAVGWMITTVQPSAAPGQPPDPNAAYVGRYHQFQVHGAQRVGDWNWYLIGPDQWVEQRNVALAQPAPPGGLGGTVIAVDTYEQSLGVYTDGRLVFATLVSSGSRYFPTRPGTFQIWARLDTGKMSGAYLRDRRDYYFLEDVPWILYYDGDRALHGAYWHDNFGIRSSHGCVNLSPRDARWLFEFAQVGSTVVIFSSG